MKIRVSKKIISFVATLAIILPMFSGVYVAAGDTPWVATPYHREDGTVVDGLENAVAGKKHWLETKDPLLVEVTVKNSVLSMQNGIIQRDFQLPNQGGTDFYTKSYDNLYIEKSLLKDEIMPDAYIALYDVPYKSVYKDDGIKIYRDGTSAADNTITIPEGNIMVDPDYFFVGGKDASNTFIFDGYEIIEKCEKPFDWEPNAIYGDPAAGEWPPKGKHVEFNFSAPDTFPEAYRGVKVKIIYEMYDNISAMKKRVEITNTGSNQIMVGRLAPEILNGNTNMDELLTLENTYVSGDQSTLPVNRPLPCRCDLEKESSPFKELANIHHTCYEVGPAYELKTGETLKSFDTYEIIHSTYWFELKMRERLGVYRKLFPWTSDNPLTHHNTGSLTKAVIDDAAKAGFEMIIQSYGSGGDTSGQMLSRNQADLDKYKALVDYAHEKGVAIGIYQAQYQLGAYKGGEAYGTNKDGHWNGWCTATAAFDDYWDNFKNFVAYTGLDCVEIDGAWPGTYCTSGENHVNEDKQTDPANQNSTTVGNESKYAFHNGVFDSVSKQWENSVKLLCKEFRDLGVYIKIPGWYYLNGSNKCGIGYEEAAWSQPRQEQLIYGRQIMYNASYARTMSMSWSHVPFASYHGGGNEGKFQPFKDNKEDYNWVIAQNIGNGVASDFRGNALYDDETLGILNKWVGFYQRYRGIVNSDMVHISQATYDAAKTNRKRGIKMDTLYHVNAHNEGEKGLLWVYNQTDEARTEIISVPMYYTGLTDLNYPPVPLKDSMGKNVHSYNTYPPNYGWLPKTEPNFTQPDQTGISSGSAAFLANGVKKEVISIDSNGNAKLSVTLAPMSFSFYTIYDVNEQPDVELTVGKVDGVKNTEVTENAVEITWNKEVPLTLTENGTVNTNPPVSIDSFNVYRNGTYIGRSMSNTYRDTGLAENTTYKYSVTAVSSGVEGLKSDEISVATNRDETKPYITGVLALDDKTVTVTFSENVDNLSAINLANYTFSDGVSTSTATLDGNVVTIKTSTLNALSPYMLSVENVKDVSAEGNVMNSSEHRMIYGYLAKFGFEDVANGNITDALGGADGKAYYTSALRQTVGSSADFNASKTSYGDLGSGLLNGRTNYSMSVWFNTMETGKQTLISQGQENTPTNDLTLWLENGKLHFRASDVDSTSVELAGGAVLGGLWNLATITRNGDTFTIYLNGNEVATKTQSGLKANDTQNSLLLGAIKNHAGGDRTQFFTGGISEVSVYTIPLNANHVEMLYKSGLVAFSALLDSVGAIDSKLYTDRSYQIMLAAYQSVLQSKLETLTPQEIIEAKKLLDGAVTGLVLKSEYDTLKALYSMNEKDGSEVMSALPSHAGQLINGDYMRIGTPFGRGVYLYGKMNNYITIPNSPIASLNEFSVNGWFKSQLHRTEDITSAGKQVLLSDESRNIVLSLLDNTLVLELGNGGETKTLTASKKILKETVTGGEERHAWNHFAISKKGDVFTLYLNGESVASGNLSGMTPGTSLTFGAQTKTGGTENQFNGLIDEFSFYTSALSEERIAELGGDIPFRKSEKTNLGLNKTRIGDNMTDAFRINDGKVHDMVDYELPWTARGNGALKYGYDLGKTYQITAVSLTQFYRNYMNNEVRRFRDVIIQISTSSDFTTGVTTVINTDDANRTGNGVGTDATFYSFELGNDFVLDTPVAGRYVRLINSGFYGIDGNYAGYSNVSELEVYGEDLPLATPELNLSRDKINLDVVSDREFVKVTTDIDTTASAVVPVSADESVAKVLNKDGVIQITAITKGKTTVTLTHPRDSSLTKTIQVSVKGMVPAVILNDEDESIKYSGSFTLYNSGRGADPDGVYEYMKGIHHSTAYGDYAEFTFTGTGFDIITTVNIDQGMMQILIDGEEVGTVALTVPNSTYPKRANQMNVFSKTDLPYGEHTVRVVNHKSELSGKNITIDAFRIYQNADKEDLGDVIIYALAQKASAEYAHVVPAVKAAFEKAISAAQTVFANENATQTAVDKAYYDLLELVQMLSFTGNPADLKALVELAEAINLALYTDSSANAVTDAVAAAKVILGNENSLQADIDEAKEALQSAIDALVLKPIVDKSALERKIAEGDKIDLEKYLTQGQDAFKTALENAKTVRDDANATQAEVKKAHNDLRDAIFKLRLKPDKSKLEELINKAKNIDTDKYTKNSVAALNSAVAKANDVVSNENSAANEVLAAENSVKKALDDLVLLSGSGETTATTTNKDTPKTGESKTILPSLVVMISAAMLFAIAIVRVRKMKIR